MRKSLPTLMQQERTVQASIWVASAIQCSVRGTFRWRRSEVWTLNIHHDVLLPGATISSQDFVLLDDSILNGLGMLRISSSPVPLFEFPLNKV